MRFAIAPQLLGLPCSCLRSVFCTLTEHPKRKPHTPKFPINYDNHTQPQKAIAFVNIRRRRCQIISRGEGNVALLEVLEVCVNSHVIITVYVFLSVKSCKKSPLLCNSFLLSIVGDFVTIYPRIYRFFVCEFSTLSMLSIVACRGGIRPHNKIKSLYFVALLSAKSK